MPTPAAAKYNLLQVRACYLFKIAMDNRIKPLSRKEAEGYLHAALAAFVAAWESYVENLLRDFFNVTSNASDIRYDQIHTIAKKHADKSLDKFNTPNAENTRQLFMDHIQYDPWPDWKWPKRSMNNLDTRLRLNEILKLRHSFSHGFSMPVFSWNSLPSGKCGLNPKCIHMVQRFFENLVQKTDLGLKLHIRSNYNITTPW